MNNVNYVEQKENEDIDKKYTQLLFSSIIKYIERKDNNNKVEYYINMTSEITNKNWDLIYTLDDLYKYHQYLLNTFTNLPLFPEISFAYFNLQKTKILLELYISEIIKRDDIISNPESEKFFKLKENHFDNFYKHQPILIINDIKLTFLSKFKELNLFIGGYKDKLYLLEFNETDNCFDIIAEHKAKNVISCLQFVKDENNTNYILSGLTDGMIEIFYIIDKNKYANQLFGDKKRIIVIEKKNEIKPHKNKILDFGFDYSSGYIYSCCVNSNIINITEDSNCSFIDSHKLSDVKYITGFKYVKSKNLIFISDNSNSLYIYLIEYLTNFTVLQVFHGFEGNISQFKYDVDSHLILIGTFFSEGSAYFYDISKNKIDLISKVKCDKSHRYTVTGIIFRHEKNELIVSLSKGKIQFWSLFNANPEYVVDCCNKHLYDIIIDEDKNFLFSNCDDNFIKIYKLPKLWPGEIMLINYLKVDKLTSIFDRNCLECSSNNDNNDSYCIEEKLDGYNSSSKSVNNYNDKYLNADDEEDEKNYDSSLDGWDEPKKEKIIDLDIYNYSYGEI